MQAQLVSPSSHWRQKNLMVMMRIIINKNDEDFENDIDDEGKMAHNW